MSISSRWCTIAVAGMGLAGCQASAPPPPPPPALPFQQVADVKQLMASILEPAADGYWDAVGSVDDAKGTTYIAPRTSEQWVAVRNYAYVIAESGNLLMMPPRARDQAAWITMSKELIEAGRRAIAAAEAHDTTAVFDAGAAVYDACSHCHATYVAGIAKPSAGR